MPRALILKHVPFEGPGRIAPLLVARGYALELRELHQGAEVPRALEPGELLVVMGGPMGVADVGRPEYPFLRDELALLERCVAEDAPVLGVCLGAQLLAAAAGANVAPMRDAHGERRYEIGWGEVEWLHAGAPSQLFDGLPARTPVLHWHGDRFELPSAARRLASSAACDNQAFLLGSRQVGLQFHCEVGEREVEHFLEADADFVRRVLGDGAAERIRDDTRRVLPDALRLGDRLLDNVLDVLTSAR